MQRRTVPNVMQRCIVPILLGLAAVAAQADTHSHDDMAAMPVPHNLGNVSFETSCKPAVRADFNRAVALLHSFWIPIARETFEHVAASDPGCAMAYWGEAMTDLHPLFDDPKVEDIAHGQEALMKADAAAETSPRETAYIGALHGFFCGREARQDRRCRRLLPNSSARLRGSERGSGAAGARTCAPSRRGPELIVR
jgi:hypothetical protein